MTVINCKSELWGALLIQDEVRISEDIYLDMMNVLPPLDMGSNWFRFREGDGDTIAFRKAGLASDPQYFAKLEVARKCTEDWRMDFTFRRLGDCLWKVSRIFFYDDSLRDSYEKYIDLQGTSIASIASLMGVKIRP